jgi:hypothetical protein
MSCRSLFLVLALTATGCDRDVIVLKYGVDACMVWAPPLAAASVTKAAAQVCGEGK